MYPSWNFGAHRQQRGWDWDWDWDVSPAPEPVVVLLEHLDAGPDKSHQCFYFTAYLEQINPAEGRREALNFCQWGYQIVKETFACFIP